MYTEVETISHGDKISQAARIKRRPDVFRAGTLTIVIILVGISGFHSVTSVLITNYIIHSSGSIGSIVTRPLHIEGRYVKDDLGQIVHLRGVNKVDFSDTCTGGWYTPDNIQTPYAVWDEADVRANLEEMQDWGINVIRCHFWMSWWTDDAATRLDGGTTDINMRESVRRALNLATEYGIYIVFDPWGISPPDRVESPLVGMSVDELVNFWVGFANELPLDIYPNLIIELYNEPAPADIGSWFSACQQVIDALRANGHEHIIIVQWGYCSGVDWLRRSDLPTGANVLYSQHIYRFHGSLYNNGVTYDEVYDALYYAHGFLGDYQYAVENDIPLWVGEIGAYQGASNDDEYNSYVNQMQILNEWEYGYAAFVWWRDMGWQLQVYPTFTPTRVGQALIDGITS